MKQKNNFRKKCIVCQKNCKEKYCSPKCKGIGMRIYSSFYNNIYYQKNSKQIKQYQKVYDSEKKFNYDGPIKNKIREFLVDKCVGYGIKEVLTLESKDFLFSKLLPEKKIYVYESEKTIFSQMLKNKPNNVVLFNDNISMFSNLSIFPEFVYLDFCKTFPSSKEIIFSLREQINKCKLFGLTFCLREPHNSDDSFGNYEINLINKIQNLLDCRLKVLFGQSYRDKNSKSITAPMITFLFEVEENK